MMGKAAARLATWARRASWRAAAGERAASRAAAAAERRRAMRFDPRRRLSAPRQRRRRVRAAPRSPALLDDPLVLEALRAVAGAAPRVCLEPIGRTLAVLRTCHDQRSCDARHGADRRARRRHRHSRRRPLSESPVHCSAAAGGEPARVGLRFTAAGRLILGLGTLGVFGHSLEAGAAARDPLPFKKRLFRNLNEMFALDERRAACGKAARAAAVEATAAAAAAAGFERLVQGDRLVLREGDITPDQFRALSDFLASCPHIRSLRLQGIEITAADVDKLGRGLGEIRHIAFCDNSIGLNEGSLERLVAVLLCCGLLESTSILRNSLSDEHVPQLVQLLRRHQNLGHLSLAWNGIGDQGAGRMAAVLENLCTSFRHLDLTYNCVGDEGRRALDGVADRRAECLGGASAAQVRITLLEQRGAALADVFRRAEGYDTDDPAAGWCHVEPSAPAKAFC